MSMQGIDASRMLQGKRTLVDSCSECDEKKSRRDGATVCDIVSTLKTSDEVKKAVYKYCNDGDTLQTPMPAPQDNVSPVYLPSKLDKATERLLMRIMDADMFTDTINKFDFDIKKLPLGKISKAQIRKGYEVLEKIEGLIQSSPEGGAVVHTQQLVEESARFYTLIPHDCGRRHPPVLRTLEMVQLKYEQLGVLAGIEIAQSMERKKQTILSDLKSTTEAQPNPIDINYDLLDCDLQLLDKNSEEFKTLASAILSRPGRIVKEIWKLNRQGEDKRYAIHDKLENRKLLWHGSRLAVVAAILKTGLRIMPHSGGRVGQGVYFASDFCQSLYHADRVSSNSLLFLNEVALGNEHHVTEYSRRLVEPPSGCDSVVARGCYEPDPDSDQTIVLDGREVVLPAGKPIHQKNYANSRFNLSEYLVYNESQARLRYLVLIK